MALEPSQMDEYLNSAQQSLQFEMPELALHWFEQAIALNSESVEAWSGKAEALKKLGRYEEAIAADQRAIALQTSEIWIHEGNNQARSGDIDGAIESYEKALQYSPGCYKAWFNRGFAFFKLERFEDAIESYEKALHYKPDYYKAWYNSGFSLFKLGRFSKAIENYEKALQYKSDYYEAWFNRSGALLKQGRYEEAIASFEQGLTKVLKKDNPEGWGMLHCGKGDIYFHQAQRNQNTQIARVQYGQALTFYNTARQALETFPRLYLELIQRLIKANLGIGNSEAANQWRIIGLEVFRQLLNAQSTLFQKRRVETEFLGFSQVSVDSLIEGETVIALETAERYKNRCLTWILDEWKEQVISPSYAEMRQLLNPQTAIVYWHFSDDSLTTFILTPDSEEPILLNTLQYDRAQKLQSWIKNWNTQYNDYRIKKDNQSDHSWRKGLTIQLNKLRKILDIDGIEQHLTNVDRLILIPHRDLHRFPLHAFFPSFTTYYLPSIQIGLTLQNKPQSNYPTHLLSVEDPKTDRPQMPYAQLESALICYLFAQTTRLDETAATAEKVTKALSDRHTHVHFAGHAGYDTPPENSALILSNNERLTAKTIRHLDLSHYELIALSACETALTGNQSIETEFVGLVSAFLQAGATAVLSTLWNVSEIFSTWLILKFYQLQMPPAEALKTAQTWLQSLTYGALLGWLDRWLTILPVPHPYRQDIQDEITLIQKKLNEHKIDLQQTPYSDPYHWAAFTLTGRGL